jgi:FKBP-type peptidyl-prolyl cis-trans isomerase FklB
MKQLLSVFIVSVTFMLPFCQAQEQVLLKEQKAKDSYSLGYDFGANLKRQGVEVDPSVLLSAIRDGLESKMPALDSKEIGDNLLQMRKKLMIRQDQRYREFAARNLEEGKAFLEANKMKEGINVLHSGLQYKILKNGTGRTPKPSDSVTVHYRGNLIDGKEFDSSYDRGKPTILSLGGMMKGWQEALTRMQTGSKWQIFVPSDLAYGKRQSSRIPPNSALVFEIELLDIRETVAPSENESAIFSQNISDEERGSGKLFSHDLLRE